MDRWCLENCVCVVGEGQKACCKDMDTEDFELPRLAAFKETAGPRILALVWRG